MRSVRARAAALVGGEDLAHQRGLARRVAAVVRELRQAPAHLDRRLERRRIQREVALVRLGRLRLRVALLVQLGGLPERIARDLRILAGDAEALELRRGIRPLALLEVGDGELLAHLGLQRVVREALAEVLERLDRAVPVLERDQRGGGVVLRRSRASPSPARRPADAGEARRRFLVLAAGARLLALLVDRGGQALDQVAARRIVGRRRA